MSELRVAPGLEPLLVDLESLERFPGNYRRGRADQIALSLRRFGQLKPIVVQASTRRIVAGNHTADAAELEGWDQIAAVFPDLSDSEAEAYLVADNRLSDLAENDDAALAAALSRLDEAGQLAGTGWQREDVAELHALLAAFDGLPSGGSHSPPASVPLAERFVAPPFSVLDARQGWWRERKREWLALGIKSELGRGDSRPHGQGAQGGGSGERDAWITSKSGAHPSAGVAPLAPGVGMDPLARARAGDPKAQRLMGRGGASRATPTPASVKGATMAQVAGTKRSGEPVRRGLIIENVSGRDPRYYAKKQAAEALAGRALSNEEFERDHYRSDAGRGLLSDDSASYRDPGFYAQKRAVEEQLGRELSREEFLRDYYRDDQAGGGLSETGTSVFDPVLCELVYRWFSPLAGRVLDPFAGGSVRGLLAALLGRSYLGVDLSAAQLDANRDQLAPVLGSSKERQKRVRWVEGDAQNLAGLLPKRWPGADLVFSCPPYGDLERYSDDERDLSTMPRDAFEAAYRQIIAQAVAALASDRFAVFVVGEYRLADGNYAGLVPLTVSAFEEAGARFYNEAILVTAVGSLPVRVGKQFSAGRKLGKTHQNVLVFVKGDARSAATACGTVQVTMPDEEV